MFLKWMFDRVVSLLGLLLLWPVLLVAIQMMFCTVLGRKMAYAGEVIWFLVRENPQPDLHRRGTLFLFLHPN